MAVGEDARGVLTSSNDVPKRCRYPGRKVEAPEQGQWQESGRACAFERRHEKGRKLVND